MHNIYGNYNENTIAMCWNRNSGDRPRQGGQIADRGPGGAGENFLRTMPVDHQTPFDDQPGTNA
ncbi:MAG: hypothetical protein HC871_14660 [Rhizobiales bacterium]|nr:hypothetical protein [Hyphomicrobiales bacterium]